MNTLHHAQWYSRVTLKIRPNRCLIIGLDEFFNADLSELCCPVDINTPFGISGKLLAISRCRSHSQNPQTQSRFPPFTTILSSKRPAKQ
jgi:hypothetical protein